MIDYTHSNVFLCINSLKERDIILQVCGNMSSSENIRRITVYIGLAVKLY